MTDETIDIDIEEKVLTLKSLEKSVRIQLFALETKINKLMREIELLKKALIGGKNAR